MKFLNLNQRLESFPKDFYMYKITRVEMKPMTTYLIIVKACHFNQVIYKIGTILFNKNIGIPDNHQIRRVQIRITSSFMRIAWKTTDGTGSTFSLVERIFKDCIPKLKNDIYHVDFNLVRKTLLNHEKDIKLSLDKSKLFKSKDMEGTFQFYTKGFNESNGKMFLICPSETLSNDKFINRNIKKINEEFFENKYARFGIHFGKKNSPLRTFSFYQLRENLKNVPLNTDEDEEMNCFNYKDLKVVIINCPQEFGNIEIFLKFIDELALFHCY